MITNHHSIAITQREECKGTMLSPLPKQHRVLPSRARGTSPVSLCLLTPNSQASPKRIFSSVPPACHHSWSNSSGIRNSLRVLRPLLLCKKVTGRACARRLQEVHVQMQMVPLHNIAVMLYAQHRSGIHGITHITDFANGCCCRHVMLQSCNLPSKHRRTQEQLVCYIPPVLRGQSC